MLLSAIYALTRTAQACLWMGSAVAGLRFAGNESPDGRITHSLLHNIWFTVQVRAGALGLEPHGSQAESGGLPDEMERQP
jgi:hypothetical protein